MPERLRVRLLGEFRLEGAELGGLRSRKARVLLKVLALAEGRAVRSDRLIEALWGDDLPADPARDLAVLMSRARASVGPDRVRRVDGGYALVADEWDVAELRTLAAEARRRLDAGDAAGARPVAEAAVALVRGPLLADEPDAPWAAGPRAAAATDASAARLAAAAAALSTGHPLDAANHARAALEHDPYDEAALRLLMRAHVAAGRPASALVAYAATRRLLADDLGVDPAEATEALHTEVLLGGGAAGTLAVAPEPGVLPGREVELAALDDALRRAGAAAEVVVVRGEAGIGKTRLVTAWAERARRAGAVVLEGRADELGASLTLQPVTDALIGHLRALDEASAAAALGEDAPTLAPVLGDTRLQAAPPGRGPSAEALQAALFGALVRTMARLGPPGRVALVLDDLHLADAATVAWLAFVLRRRESARLLVVAVVRKGEELALTSTGTLAVGPLGLAAAEVLAGPERAAELLARSGGNALLLVELAASPDDEVPATVRDAVEARLRRIGEAAPTLRAAAVLGPTVDVDLLAGILGIHQLTALEHLEQGLRHAFLVEQDGELVFRHELVRAAVAAATSASRRAWLHREAARALAQRPGGRPLALARHARLSDDRALAAAGLAAAAAQELQRYDFAAAERALGDALALDDTVSSRLARSRVRLARGDFDGAVADAEAARAAGAEAGALELLAWVARTRHDFPTALRLGHAGAAAATDATTRASCLLAVGLAHRGDGDLRAADRVLADVAAGSPPQSLGVGAWIGVLRVHQGRPDEALALLEPVASESVDTLHVFWVEHVLQMTAHAHALLGHVSTALSLLDRLDTELDRRGSRPRYDGLTATYRSWILRLVGAEGAEQEADQALARGGLGETRTQALLDIADTALLQRRWEGAETALEAARAGMSGGWFQNRWRAEQRAGLVTAQIELDTGEPARAADAAAAVVAAAAERGDLRYATLGRLHLARATARTGGPVDVEAVWADLERLPLVASLESWRLAADVGRDLRLDAAHRMAERYVERLLPHAGPHAAALRVAAAAHLGRTGPR